MSIAAAISALALGALAAGPAAPASVERDFHRMDANGDGHIDRAEWRADAWRAHIEQWGPAADGRIPVASIVSALCRVSQQDPRCVFGARAYATLLDRNRDGFVDRAESDRECEGLFQANDLNRDGVITLTEMNAVASHPPAK